MKNKLNLNKIITLSFILLIVFSFLLSKQDIQIDNNVKNLQKNIDYFYAWNFTLPWTKTAWNKNDPICASNKFDDVLKCMEKSTFLVEYKVNYELLKGKYVYWINKQWNYYLICKKPKNNVVDSNSCEATTELWQSLLDTEKTIISYQ